ncbi:uncharacterized protein SPSK_10656 [Sporothrix schenckii 1099-18]|uniref:Uncharacterized protein n=1 Tax=Sporothrix schenckii 1099-18 TaxID=1397361 RepID=A0A0F2LWS8_SPOSC|nr:uncharacterized protein SPSK_10656 [Sporothrix schenckii 1099-18]KJR80361.1 hypothetical protein SPSK_10656 [Sporothrix schenckii 1099-18]
MAAVMQVRTFPICELCGLRGMEGAAQTSHEWVAPAVIRDPYPPWPCAPDARKVWALGIGVLLDSVSFSR